MKYKEEFVAQIENINLDLKHPYYDLEDNPNDVEIPRNQLDYANVPSIEIKELESIINQLKENGADRVYIASHVNHRGYYFYGVKLKQNNEDK